MTSDTTRQCFPLADWTVRELPDYGLILRVRFVSKGPKPGGYPIAVPLGLTADQLDELIRDLQTARATAPMPQ